MAMPQPAPVPTPADPEPAGEQPNAGQVRVLKIIVIGLGVLLLLGFAAVIGRIAWLATQPGRGLTAQRPAQTVNLALPPGAAVRQTMVSGDRLTIHFESPRQSGILIVNLTTGQLLSRIEFHPEAPRQ